MHEVERLIRLGQGMFEISIDLMEVMGLYLCP